MFRFQSLFYVPGPMEDGGRLRICINILPSATWTFVQRSLSSESENKKRARNNFKLHGEDGERLKGINIGKAKRFLCCAVALTGCALLLSSRQKIMFRRRSGFER
jgi:hypothetical protein